MQISQQLQHCFQMADFCEVKKSLVYLGNLLFSISFCMIEGI